jgi:hypothetical protein
MENSLGEELNRLQMVVLGTGRNWKATFYSMIRQLTRGGGKNGETPEIPLPETAQVALLSFQNLGHASGDYPGSQIGSSRQQGLSVSVAAADGRRPPRVAGMVAAASIGR